MKYRLSGAPKLWLAFLGACSLLTLGTWATTAATICSNPRVPVPATQHVIPYNCHGMTVFISHTQDLLLHGLFPVFLLLSLMTVAVAILTVVKVRVSVKVQVRNAADGCADNNAPQTETNQRP